MTCPDCKLGTIRPNDCCTNCGLPFEDIEAAAGFLRSERERTNTLRKSERFERKRRARQETRHRGG